MHACVIATGSELLRGRVRDENGALIAAGLFRLDMELGEMRFVGDRVADIRSALDETAARYEVLFITGGLGPTEDDLTCGILCDLAGVGTEIHGPSLDRMNDFFSKRGMEPRPGDMKMVTVPIGSRVFPNEVGMACGFAMPFRSSRVIALPGPPRELKRMWEAHVLPWLREGLGVKEKMFLTFRTLLLREAEADERVKSLELGKSGLEWGICTAPGINEITVTSTGGANFDESALRSSMRRLFGESLLDGESLEEEVVALLAGRGLTLSLAESCTGGMIGARITDVPGSSRVFRGGAVAYSNEAKESVLGVSRKTLEIYGAVSVETAREMAEGARKVFGADIGISTTGIAGPGGGSPDKPVGTVCFGIADGAGSRGERQYLPGDRGRVRAFSAVFALDMLRRYLKRI